MKEEKKTGIVILNYNNIEETISCIDTVIKHSNIQAIKIAVVDNASTQVVVNAIDRAIEKIKVQTETLDIVHIKVESNLGYARGNNVGLRYFFKDEEIGYLMILNNDVLFTMDIVTSLMKSVDRLINPAFVTPLVMDTDGITPSYSCARKRKSLLQLLTTYSYFIGRVINNHLRSRTFIIQNNSELLNLEEIVVEIPLGACLFAKKEVWMLTNGFDDNTFLYYEEDIICEHFMRKGLKNYLIPRLHCTHLGGVSTKKRQSSFVMRASLYSLLYYMKNIRKCPSLYVEYVKLRGNIAIKLVEFVTKIKNIL